MANPVVPVVARQNYDYREWPGLECKDRSLTQQHQANDVDINQILDRYEAGSILSTVASNPGMYGDFSSVPDYLEAADVFAKANQQFEALPAKVRSRFENDPVKFLTFVGDPKNEEELINMGLASRKPSVETPAVSTPSPVSGDAI